MKHYLFLIVTAAVCLLSSCASQRALTGDIQGVSAHIDAQLKAFELDEGASGTIKMKRGEGLQISLTKFGIEGVRVICTTDSVYVINRLSKTYFLTTYREVDAFLGGEGNFTFENVQAYFWNDNGRGTNYANLPIGGLIPVELKTSYGRNLRTGDYHVPKRINIDINGADGAVETGTVKIKLSKVKAANNWHPAPEISSKYKCLNIATLFKTLLKK